MSAMKWTWGFALVAQLGLGACAAGTSMDGDDGFGTVQQPGAFPGADMGAGMQPTDGTQTPTPGQMVQQPPAAGDGSTTPPATAPADGSNTGGAGAGGDMVVPPGDGTTMPPAGDGMPNTMPPTGDLGGSCCSDGDCVCHGPDPSGLTSNNGPFQVQSYRVSNGTIFYPTDAEPPLAGIAICPGFLNSGPEMEPWGPFYASHGFVMIAVDTIGSDVPQIRAVKLLDGVSTLKAENENSSSPIFGKMAGRYGTTGYSMGGGGTTIASGEDSTLYSSIGLAAWGPVTSGVTVPTLLLCGSSDGVAPCNMSQSAYSGLPAGTPKMMVTISGASHFDWFTPAAVGGVSGQYALAFQKVFLAGDERWKPILQQTAAGATPVSEIP